jgi:hypothetical protein
MVVRVVSSTRYMTLHNELARCIVPRIFTSDYLSAGCAIDDGVVASEEYVYA